MTTPNRMPKFATHKECIHFDNGFCILNNVMVSPNQPTCSNFRAKKLMIISQVEKPYQQPRQLFQVPLHFRQSYFMTSRNPKNVHPTGQQLMLHHGSSGSQHGGIYSMSNSRGGGRGGGGRRKGRMGGFAAGPSGSCVCPSCGYTVPHRLGTPCFQQKCPKCGTPMTRKT